jgi:hypothetical protein|tara:strand:- start:646 stop:798 length:153 start_codon:yes stop_codon:yes gene_type:complete
MSKIGNYVVGQQEETREQEGVRLASVNWEDMTSEEYDEYRQNWMDKYTSD